MLYRLRSVYWGVFVIFVNYYNLSHIRSHKPVAYAEAAMATDYSPDQKRRIVSEAFETKRSSGEYPDETCVSNKGHDFINTSVFTDGVGKFIGRFLCTKCRDTAQVELESDEIDEINAELEGWDGTPIDDAIGDDA